MAISKAASSSVVGTRVELITHNNLDALYADSGRWFAFLPSPAGGGGDIADFAKDVVPFD